MKEGVGTEGGICVVGLRGDRHPDYGRKAAENGVAWEETTKSLAYRTRSSSSANAEGPREHNAS